jgi:predicted transcriptional regulator
MKTTVCSLAISMSILISLSPEIEARLQKRDMQQGQDVSMVATELLSRALELDELDLRESIAGIQKGLDYFTAGRSQSFQAFVEEQSSQHRLLIALLPQDAIA